MVQKIIIKISECNYANYSNFFLIFICLYLLQQFLDLGLKVLDGSGTRYDVVAAVDEEEVGHCLHVIEHQALGANAVGIAHADPGQGLGLLLPEMLIGVEAYLIDLQALGVVLIVEFAEHDDAGGRVFEGEDVEVEQHHLALQVGEMPHLPLVVSQRDIEHASLSHLAGVDLKIGILSRDDTLVLHALDGDVMQVLPAVGMGVVSVPTGGHGGEGPDVLLLRAGVEDQPVAQRLEESEVGVGLVGLAVDIVLHHVGLIERHEAVDAVADDADAEVGLLLLQGHDLPLQFHLLEGEFANLVAVVRAADGVVRGHAGIFALDLYGLGGVDADVDDLVGNAQAVELGRLGRIATKGETAVAAQRHGVEHLDALQSDILEIEHGVGGIGNLPLDLELVVAARGSSHRSQHHCGHFANMIHFHSTFSFCGCKGTKKK